MPRATNREESEIWVTLSQAAYEAQKRAYAPYSHYRVGCAGWAQNGKVYCGANIENGSFGATLCAERVAVALAHMDNAGPFEKMVLVALDSPTPCGICRQVLIERSPQLILRCGEGTNAWEGSIGDLYPFAFVLHQQNGEK